MNPIDKAPHADAVVDAYRQASAHEDARASVGVRAAVLAHARVVAQSSPSTTARAAALRETNRAATAANEARPLWRLAAGVVIGLVGVWLFQLSRPASTPDTTVAAASAPQTQADQPRVAETNGSPATTAQASVAAPAAAAVAPETTVAAAAAPAAPSAAAYGTAARVRAESTSPRQSARPERADPSLATARATPPVAKPEMREPASGAGIATANASGTTDAATREPLQETLIASAELRKSARAGSAPLQDPSATAAAAPRPSAAAPNAFPAQVAEPMSAAAAPPAAASPPSAAAAAAPAAAPAAISGGLASRSATAQTDKLKVSPQAAAKPADLARAESQPLDDRDRALFIAVRAGDLPALRSAIARGANVNARDENARTPLQIARERNDSAVVDALQAAGAR